MRIVVDNNYRSVALVRAMQERLSSSASRDQAAKIVAEIILDVQRFGDRAVVRYGNGFDHTHLAEKDLKVTAKEFAAAKERVSPAFRAAIRLAMQRVWRFQNALKPKDRLIAKDAGVTLKVRFAPIRRVGLYIPGGRATYPSSVYMTAIPAKVAGVKEIVIATPPRKDESIAPEVLYAAQVLGVTAVYKTGGAQAIAAMAYGTKQIPKVDKICGPGNMYVNLAKRRVLGEVGIDGFAGPSEILILADDSAEPELVAADLVSQLEHDPGLAVLVTPSRRLAEQVRISAIVQSRSAARKDVFAKWLDCSAIAVVVRDLEQGIELANRIAPEHLEVITCNATSVARRMVGAGAVFVGKDAPVPLGDYIAGPSHVLPTGGTARFAGVLSCMDFLLMRNEITGSKKALQKLGPAVKTLAYTEGLPAHFETFRLREG